MTTLLSENSVRLNSISDFLLVVNNPFGVAKVVRCRLRIVPHWDDSAFTQLYFAPVSNKTDRGFFRTFPFCRMKSTLTGLISQLSSSVAGAVESVGLSLTSSTILDAKKSVGIVLEGEVSLFF